MPNPRKPRRGSMAVWPRKRARRSYPKIRGWSEQKFDKASLLGFIGYKAGMTHIMGIDTKKTSMTKNEEIFMPVTIIECPPMRLFAARFYKTNAYGCRVDHDFFFKPSKDLQRKISIPSNIPNISDLDKNNPDNYSDIAVLAYTQPSLTGFGKKRPELVELRLCGSNKDKLEFIKNHVDKEIGVEQIFKEAQQVDVRAVTKGKGVQGPVKRFGIALKPHKTEKGRRQPGCRSGWYGWLHMMYRTAYAGQMGYHQRVQYNNQIVKISSNPEEINPKDGFVHYGTVRTTYLLIKGSVPGPKKRAIVMTQPLRQMKEEPLLTITHISTQSKQGR